MTKKTKKFYRREIIQHCLDASTRLLTVHPNDSTREKAVEYIEVARIYHSARFPELTHNKVYCQPNDSILTGLIKAYTAADNDKTKGDEREQLRQQSHVS